MKFDTVTAADYASQKLASLLERATRDANEITATGDIPQSVAYFAKLQETVKGLQDQLSEVQKLVDTLSWEILPTMFQNQMIDKTIHVVDVGRVTVNVRWSGSLIDKETGLGWLRQTGNEGLIQETVNAQTLGAFAKTEIAAGHPPLPADIFKITSKPYISISDKPKKEDGSNGK